mgnify:CR=1 FL=1
MGEVQLEILQTILQERFGLTVAFSEGGILYKETLTRAVEGIGHYEPLRHYARYICCWSRGRGAAVCSWRRTARPTRWPKTGNG